MSKFVLPFLIFSCLPALSAIDQCPGARPVTPGVPHRNAATIAPGVMPGNGSFHYAQEDLATAGRVAGLRLRRVYRSDMSYDGPLGYGWTCEYLQAAIVLPDTGDIRWYDENGHVHNFVDRGSYFAEHCAEGVLVKFRFASNGDAAAAGEFFGAGLQDLLSVAHVLVSAEIPTAS